MKSGIFKILVALSLGLTYGKIKSFIPDLAHKTFVTQFEPNEQLSKPRLVPRDIQLNYIDFAKNHMKTKLGFKEGTDYKILRNHTSDSRVGYVYLKQYIQGKEVFNGDINLSINLNSEMKIVAFGSSFYKNNNKVNQSSTFKTLNDESITKQSLMECLAIALKEAGLDLSNYNRDGLISSLKVDGNGFSYTNQKNGMNKLKATQGWLQLSSMEIVPVWSMDVIMKKQVFNAKVTLEDKKLVSMVDLVSRATYRVYPIDTDGAKSSSRVLVDSQEDPTASRLGWHNNGKDEFNYTRGNNVYVRFSNYELNLVEDDTSKNVTYGNSNSAYDFPLDLSEKDHYKYLNASMTQVFYVANKVHDLLYHYGFDEAAGNFQEKNFGIEGKSDDAVQIFPQFNGQKNGAGFATLPDGKKSYMFIGMVYLSNPPKDLSFDNTVLVHEYGHGLSHRLVGGADNHMCLFSREGKGMGEGWSDLLAIMVLMKPEYTRSLELGIAQFTADVIKSRATKYSVSMATNAVTYKSLENISDEHIMGHVWATILYEVYWNLVDKLGFTPEWIGEGSANPTEYGNTLMLKLVIESMKKLSCEPSFIDARDALILADQNITGGANKCDIWLGFSKRGLGFGAKSTTTTVGDEKNTTILTKYQESYAMPDGCDNTTNFLELIG